MTHSPNNGRIYPALFDKLKKLSNSLKETIKMYIN